jgi:hypothetical protein
MGIYLLVDKITSGVKKYYTKNCTNKGNEQKLIGYHSKTLLQTLF